jgi:hypothetical protein
MHIHDDRIDISGDDPDKKNGLVLNLKMLQKQHNHRHSNQPRSERRIKGKELQDKDVSGYRAINSNYDVHAKADKVMITL